jgi:hypothetical protein
MPSPEVVGGKRSVHVDTPAAGRDPTPGGAPYKRQRPVDRLDPAAGQQGAVAGQHGGVAGQQGGPSLDSTGVLLNSKLFSRSLSTAKC